MNTTTICGIVHDGKIELPANAGFEEGARVLVTVLPVDDSSFWQGTSQSSLDSIWDNEQDDIYAQLL